MQCLPRKNFIEQKIAGYILESNVPIGAACKLLSNREFIELVKRLPDSGISKRTAFVERALDAYKARVDESRCSLVGEYFSISVDETKRRNDSSLICIIAKTYKSCILVSSIDATNTRLDSKQYLMYLKQFLNPLHDSKQYLTSEETIILQSDQVVQVMTDNCPTMNRFKQMAVSELSRSISGNCI